ncbi:MAG TPA: amidohydrolase [Flavobacteriales bacterium]|nr:amidohydrolase [Flavobacteriales bacterium]
MTVTEAVAIKDGKIIETGKERHIMNKYSANEYVDAKGRAVYPGFFDAHCHILNYGKTFIEVDLRNCKSWEECVQKTKEFAAKNKSAWIRGRGWDQNEWAVKEFPTNELLNAAFPNTPVYLTRVDGHAAIVNQIALDKAGITVLTSVSGGTVITKGDNPTGVLIDNAMELVKSKMPNLSKAEIEKALSFAGANTTSYGLTTLCDAGSEIGVFKIMEQMQAKNMFMPKVYGMLVPDKDGFAFAAKNGIYETEKMIIRSFKIVSDGALGSRGACLKEPYSDAHEVMGKLLLTEKGLDSLIAKMYDLGYQVNTHCIGDSSNALMLRLYAKYLEKTNDYRWRIEHAQIMDVKDMGNFAKYSIIPSVQPTHAVSDMPWALDRVGNKRIKGAYLFKTLLNQNGMIALGTDFPVEEINPFKTFYAAISRKYYDGKPITGLQNEVLTREEAFMGMSKWAAMAAFMLEKTGTLEKGKAADIMILDRDIMKVDEKDILSTMVIATFINGKRVHSLE